MITFCTGQTGLNKKNYIDKVCKVADSNKKSLKCFHTGKLMYEKDRSITAGRILRLPYKQLNLTRELVYSDIVSEISSDNNYIINTHATFRWHHGLFPAFNIDTIEKINPDIFITLIDDVDRIKLSFESRKESPNFSMKDILIWREEEVLATEILAKSLKRPFYIIPMQHHPELIYKIIFEKELNKTYLSFPISHVQDQPDILEEITSFKKEINNHFIAFDPYTMKEKRLSFIINDAKPDEKRLNVDVDGKNIIVDVEEIRSVQNDIDGQIVSRDFKLIEQSDMIIAFIPDLGGKPIISSGVERELQYAYDTTKEVYVIWPSKSEPSPFITTNATQVFKSIDEARKHFI